MAVRLRLLLLHKVNHCMKFSFAKRQAFTLMEIIIYIAVFSLIMMAAMGVSMNLVSRNVSMKNSQEVYGNARLAMNTISKTIRSALDINTGSSTFASHPGVLSLKYSASSVDDIIIDTYTKSVVVGGVSTTIRSLRVKEGAGAYQDLTNEFVDVTNFVVRNLSRGSAKIVNIEVTFQKVSASDDSDYDESVSLETAVGLRQ